MNNEINSKKSFFIIFISVKKTVSLYKGFCLPVEINDMFFDLPCSKCFYMESHRLLSLSYWIIEKNNVITLNDYPSDIEVTY